MSAQSDKRLQNAADQWVQLQDREPTEEEVTQWLVWLDEGENAAAFKDIDDLAQRLHHTRETAPEKLQPLRVGKVLWSRPVIWGLAAAVMLSIGIAWVLRDGLSSNGQLSGADISVYTTSVAKQREVVLPDGSRITLGGASSIQTRYTAQRREIRLISGEAYFDVQPESANRPFIVDVGAASVQALGTAFNIRRNEARISVTVTEGRVQVVRASNTMQALAVAVGLRQPQSLQAGRAEQVIVETRSEQLSASAADPRRATAWREGRLEFVDEPLDVVIDNVSRYSQVGLVAADPRLHGITYTGTFVPGHFDSWLDALKDIFDLQVQREGETLVVTTR